MPPGGPRGVREGRRRGVGPLLRLLFTSDLEGRRSHYLRTARAAREHRVDALVLGGNLLPAFDDPVRGDERQARFLEDFLEPWLASLRLAIPHLSTFLVLGNRDAASTLPRLERAEANGGFACIHGRLLDLGPGRQILGFPYSPPTDSPLKDLERRDRREDTGFPARSPRRCHLSTPEGLVPISAPDMYFDRHPSLEEELEALPSPADPARTVFVSSAPPHGTELDILHDGSHGGSRAIRAWIEWTGPFLSLHGQFRDSPRRSGRYAARLGTTLAFNPGQDFGEWHGVVLDLDNPKRYWHSTAGYLT